MQRIVLFAPHYAEYSVRLAAALAARADVLLILQQRNRVAECGDRFADALPPRLRVIEYDSSRRIRQPRATLAILAALVSFRPTAALVQEEESPFAAGITRLIGRFCPILLTVHDPSPHTGIDADYQAANLTHQNAIRAAARAFHVHGRHCRDVLVARVGERRPVLSTPHGILLTPRGGEHLPAEAGRVLMFGRMEAYKGLDVLLDAADRLRAEGDDITLAVAGRGSEIERLRGRLAGVAHVDLLDRFLSPAEAVAQFQRAAVVALPYRDATQSGVVAAAFGNDRPVVASATGGLTEAVTDDVDGLLVPPGDPAALAGALHRMRGETLARLSAGAARTAATTFSWSAIADSMHAFMAEHGIGRPS